jgi:hypothetical protein
VQPLRLKAITSHQPTITVWLKDYIEVRFVLVATGSVLVEDALIVQAAMVSTVNAVFSSTWKSK